MYKPIASGGRIGGAFEDITQRVRVVESSQNRASSRARMGGFADDALARLARAGGVERANACGGYMCAKTDDAFVALRARCRCRRER